jgi:hypothetical protein
MSLLERLLGKEKMIGKSMVVIVSWYPDGIEPDIEILECDDSQYYLDLNKFVRAIRDTQYKQCVVYHEDKLIYDSRINYDKENKEEKNI